MIVSRSSKLFLAIWLAAGAQAVSGARTLPSIRDQELSQEFGLSQDLELQSGTRSRKAFQDTDEFSQAFPQDGMKDKSELTDFGEDGDSFFRGASGPNGNFAREGKTSTDEGIDSIMYADRNAGRKTEPEDTKDGGFLYEEETNIVFNRNPSRGSESDDRKPSSDFGPFGQDEDSQFPTEDMVPVEDMVPTEDMDFDAGDAEPKQNQDFRSPSQRRGSFTRGHPSFPSAEIEDNSQHKNVAAGSSGSSSSVIAIAIVGAVAAIAVGLFAFKFATRKNETETRLQTPRYSRRTSSLSIRHPENMDGYV